MNSLFQRLLKVPYKTSGTLMFLTGIVILMGIITAEIFYPPGYSTSQNEISDLGATRPPDSIIVQPSATIFNMTMMAAGVMLIAAAYFIHRAFRDRVVTGAILVLGIGILGVGVFPGNNAATHPLFALTTFVAAGISAVVSSRVTSAPFRTIAIMLGGITLIFLLLAFFFSGAIFPILGDGGTERWVAYPSIIWIMGFGGYLLADPSPSTAEIGL
jgi:hypothetical membrane protein